MNATYVHFGTEPDKGKKKTVRYSKVRPLVITRAVDKEHQKYVLTHRRSGLAITSVSRLQVAFRVLHALLPLADWRQGREALEHDTALLAKCREALTDLPAQVKTRSSY